MDPTQRFSNRVENYVKYRPSYPADLILALGDRCGLGPQSVVADIGSGTGIFSLQLLQAGWRVYGVEPNAAMRKAAEQRLASAPGFVSVAGRAEQTSLDNSSIDLIAAAQAFHWFDQAAARAEFRRILKRRGQVALIWNERQTTTPFLQEYERALEEFGTDYGNVRHENVKPDIAKFLSDHELLVFPNRQHCDLEALIGRTLSCSYVPPAGDDNHQNLMDAVADAFHRHQSDGQVTFEYVSLAYIGRVE